MNRSIDRWSICSPAAMVNQSKTATQYAFEDARHDILELHEQNKRLRAMLCMAAYPKRGTEEEALSITDFATLVQSVYTLDQLEAA